jgi:hypothetical protein
MTLARRRQRVAESDSQADSEREDSPPHSKQKGRTADHLDPETVSVASGSKPTKRHTRTRDDLSHNEVIQDGVARSRQLSAKQKNIGNKQV